MLFCTLGARGALATKTLNDMGYENVYNLENGLQDWMKYSLNNHLVFKYQSLHL